MSTPHPMWSAIKRGMVLGGLIGLNVSFLVVIDAYYGMLRMDDVLTSIMIGGATGTVFGAALGVAWRRMVSPLSRLEADLKAAAALRDKGLLNDGDFQSLKARILNTHPLESHGAQDVLTIMAWMCLIGITMALGMLLADHPNDVYPPTHYITILILPMIAAGIGAGTAVAAIIQSALQGGSKARQASQQAMLGVGGFDPLGSLRETESEPVLHQVKGR